MCSTLFAGLVFILVVTTTATPSAPDPPDMSYNSLCVGPSCVLFLGCEDFQGLFVPNDPPVIDFVALGVSTMRIRIDESCGVFYNASMVIRTAGEDNALIMQFDDCSLESVDGRPLFVHESGPPLAEITFVDGVFPASTRTLGGAVKVFTLFDSIVPYQSIPASDGINSYGAQWVSV